MSLSVKSVDGRNKLPGFLKYLKDRKKSAYGRFGDNKGAMWVISYIQKTGESMECRFAWDLTTIPGIPMKQPVAAPPPKPAAPAAPAKASIRKGKAGLLGKLVSSQKRTNAHVIVANKKPQQPATQQNNADEGENSGPKKTAQQVMAEFRQEMEQKFLDFDIASDSVLRVEIKLSEYQKDLATTDDMQKVTMSILRYMVEEAAEEVNEEWIAHKEPSEFTDEITIAVYKEGEAPPEVVEELNRGELPDEIKGKAQAMQANQQKAEEQKAHKAQMEMQKKALQAKANNNVKELNQNKRDRRTVEELQRGDPNPSKRSRTE
eukprot:Sro659_g182820.2  (319) ;mRNA; f:801-1757